MTVSAAMSRRWVKRFETESISAPVGVGLIVEPWPRGFSGRKLAGVAAALGVEGEPHRGKLWRASFPIGFDQRAAAVASCPLSAAAAALRLAAETVP